MAAAASIVHKNLMQLLLGVGAITQEELMSKLEECIQFVCKASYKNICMASLF